jgi:hypothetical protein
MALDFNLLRPTAGPNPVNAFLQGQQSAQDRAMAQQNAMLDREAAQQKMAQEQEMNALRRQQLTGQIQTQEETRTKNKAAEKTGMFRERLLRARTPADARSLVQMQYADPDLAPVLSQASTLEQALAEISDDPAEFEKYRQQEAMGMSEWIKSQIPKETTPSADIKTMQSLGFPITQAGFAAFRDAQRPERLLTPDEEAQKIRIAVQARPPAPVTNITNVQEKAEKGAYGKMLVEQYGDISKAAGLATKSLPAIEANLGALNAGLSTGFGTDAKKAGARVLGALGVQDAEKFATTAEVFQANAINAVLQKQLEQKGPQTESDARRIEQVGAELAKTKGANEFILSLAKEQLKRDVDQRNFYDNYRRRTGSFDGAEDAWFSGEGGRSLFDRPGLKKFAPGTAAQSAAAQIPTARAPTLAAPNLAQERANANAAIAAGAPAAAVRQRFKQNTGQEL